MIKKGSTIIANTDHFDEEFGDLYIEKGDKFKVLEHNIMTIRMKPVDERKYAGEAAVVSKEEFFDEIN